ncbi:MAG TPA: hypothetical protein VE615_02470 [Gaiellaceae bacterium]|nr:hypothetical protein [Gaiellaceae bacterium]
MKTPVSGAGSSIASIGGAGASCSAGCARLVSADPHPLARRATDTSKIPATERTMLTAASKRAPVEEEAIGNAIDLDHVRRRDLLGGLIHECELAA